jgi:putative ABC transport system permease protein
MAVRAAIGADRARLVRQLLSESLVLAAIGGTAGVLLALWAGRILTGLPTDWLPVPVHFDFQLDGTALVVTQLALSLVLLVAGALLARGLLVARGTNLGFDPTPVSLLDFNLQMNGYDVDRAMALRKRILAELRALPGVEGAALVSRLPLAPDINMEAVRIRGHHGPQDDGTHIDSVSIGAGYFDVVGVPIVEGRAITEDDVEGAWS